MVLNAEAVEWARREGIEIRCAATRERDPGTRIREGGGLDKPRVVGVTAHPGLFYLGPEDPGGAHGQVVEVPDRGRHQIESRRCSCARIFAIHAWNLPDLERRALMHGCHVGSSPMAQFPLRIRVPGPC